MGASLLETGAMEAGRHTSRATFARILKKIPIFFGLLDREYEQLIDACQWTQLPAGSHVFVEGEAGHDMYVLLSGRVDVVTGEGVLVHAMEPGELFGEMAMVAPLRRTATAVVREEAAMLRLSRDGLELLLGRAPRISYLIMRNIAEALALRLAAANERLLAGH